jgi:hypothetical protein
MYEFEFFLLLSFQVKNLLNVNMTDAIDVSLIVLTGRNILMFIQVTNPIIAEFEAVTKVIHTLVLFENT